MPVGLSRGTLPSIGACMERVESDIRAFVRYSWTATVAEYGARLHR